MSVTEGERDRGTPGEEEGGLEETVVTASRSQTQLGSTQGLSCHDPPRRCYQSVQCCCAEGNAGNLEDSVQWTWRRRRSIKREEERGFLITPGFTCIVIRFATSLVVDSNTGS